MSIAGTYVQIVHGSNDDQLARLSRQDQRLVADMAKTPSKSTTLANRIKNFFTAPFRDDEEPTEAPQQEPVAEPEVEAKPSAFSFSAPFKLKERKCCDREPGCCCGVTGKVIYVILSTVTVIKALVLIVVGSVVAVAVRAYDTDHTGKAVAYVLLVFSAGATVALVIWSNVAVFKKQRRHIKRLALALFLLALFQLILTLVAISPSAKSSQRLRQELAESFDKAKQNNLNHQRQWAATQYGLSCCGLNSPEDYRSPNLPLHFPPDVPISCCPAYDPNRPGLAQERERQLCKARKEFYTVGCADPLVTYFSEAGIVVTSLITGLFFLQICLALWSCCCARRSARKGDSDEAVDSSSPVPAPPATPTA